MTFEKTLALIHQAELRVSNLYQTARGTWRCNLRTVKLDPRGFQPLVSFYGQGSRPEQALYSAFAMAGQPGGLYMQEKLRSIQFLSRDPKNSDKTEVKTVTLDQLGLGA